MNLNRYLEIQGQHALFSPSQSAWIRYDDEKIADRLRNRFRAPLGTEIHEYAASQIKLAHRKKNIKSVMEEIENYIYQKTAFHDSSSLFYQSLLPQVRKLPKGVFEAVKNYINDGIKYDMDAEQRLGYSEDIFGTADTCCFHNGTLRIHDLKTGDSQPHMEQLEIYAALYLLSNNIKPAEAGTELRIYHQEGVFTENPDPIDISDIMQRIVEIDRIAAKFRKDRQI